MKKLVLSLLTIVSFALGSTAQTDYGALALNHQLAIGMTYGDVLTALGNPCSQRLAVTRDPAC